MKIKIKSPFEIEITTKQQLELYIIEVFNWCLKTWLDWLIELDEDNYIDFTYIWEKNKLSCYISLHTTYFRWDYTLKKLLNIVLKDKFILDNFS